MTSTVRSVRVVMEADVAGYIANIRLAGHETDAAFSHTGTQLAGVNRGLKEVDTSSKQLVASQRQVEQSSARTGKEVDKLSGRLHLLAEAGIVLGPALIPLATGILPAITGGITGLGAGAAAIGVTILALHGLGAGIKALDAYNLDPTVQNLAKLRAEEQKLGPAGVQFLHYIDQLEPKLRELQQVARAGMFPGVEAGITDLLQRLPLVRGTVKSVSMEMGTLAAEAGHSLSSSEWRPFFQYVRSTAAPTLDAFAHSAGNVALGLANLLVAFDPLSRSFSGGLQQMTASFADWSKHLGTNQGFQNFLLTLQQSGPQAVAFLGALVHALAGVLKAAQPWGAVVLPILTDALKIFAAIANSPIGPALYGAAAAMIVYSRAVKVAEASQAKFAAGFAAIPELLAVVAVVAAVTTIKTANDQLTESLKASQAALRSGDQAQIAQSLSRTNAELQKIHDTTSNVDWFGAPSWDKAKQIIPLVEGELAKFLGTDKRLTFAQGELRTALQEGGGAADLFGHDIGLTGKQMAVAANEAGALDKALSHLNGWFSRRDAVLAYKDDIDSLAKGLKNGFTRDDAKNLDSLGESILQVANQIRNPAHRADFLQNARAELEALARDAGPKARKAIQAVIAAFDDKGLTHPKTPKIDPPDTGPVDKAASHVKHQFDIMRSLEAKPTIGANDDPFQQTYGSVKSNMAAFNRAKATGHISVDPGNSFSILGSIKAEIASLHDKTVTVTTRHVGGGLGPVTGSADGSTVPKGGGYVDKHLYLLAPGEEVISDRHGQASRHRGLLKAINAGRMADGGTTGGHSPETRFDTHPGDSHNKAHDPSTWVVPLGLAIDATTKGLKGLKAELGHFQDALAKEKQKLQNLTSARDTLSSSVSGSLIHDPFGNGLAGFDAQVAADTSDISAMAKALATLVHNGLDPKSALYQALAASDDVTTAQQLAALSSTDLSARAQSFQQRQDLATQTGQTVGNQVYAQAIREETRATKELRNEVKFLTAVIKALPKQVHDGAKAGSHDGSKSGSEAGSAAGTHRGMSERSSDLRAMVRTGGPR